MTISRTVGTAGCVEWAVAARPIEGEIESGDCHVVEQHGRRVLLAAIDGLGHGPEAAAAAERASGILQAHGPGKTVDQLFRLCHDDLRSTRGAVMSVAIVDGADGTITWGGIGNVEGVLITAGGLRRGSITLRGGVVGGLVPAVRVEALPLADGDVIVFATDGIQTQFTERIVPAPPARMADGILDRYARPTDDALVLVAHFRRDA